MNTPWDIIKLCETDNSRLFKESVIKTAANDNNQDFFDGLKLALDPLVTFGVKQVPIKDTDDGNSLEYSDFFTVANKLINRELTGHSARDIIIQMMNQATMDQWNYWYRRILIKDLRCGVSSTTVNKVVKKINKNFLIPIFAVQLAEDSANHDTKLTGKKLIDIKMDGCRTITVVYPSGRVEQFSRNGKEFLNFEKIKEQFSTIAHQFTQPMVFDGEVMSSSFQDLMKQVYRKRDVEADDAVLYLFDMMTLHDFEHGVCNITQITRSNNLKEWYENCQLPNVQILSNELVDLDTEDGQNRMQEINKIALAGKYEGIMMKDPDAKYVNTRNVSWLKMKPYIEVSLEVIDFEEGTGRNVGRLGAIVCSGIEDGRNITVSVGGGFSDTARVDFWNNRENIIGRIVEVRADAITQNKDGSYSLRFPRFRTFRGFDVGEKI